MNHSKSDIHAQAVRHVTYRLGLEVDIRQGSIVLDTVFVYGRPAP